MPVSRRSRASLFVHRTLVLNQILNSLHVPKLRRTPTRRTVPLTLLLLVHPFQQLQVVNRRDVSTKRLLLLLPLPPSPFQSRLRRKIRNRKPLRYGAHPLRSLDRRPGADVRLM